MVKRHIFKSLKVDHQPVTLDFVLFSQIIQQLKFNQKIFRVELHRLFFCKRLGFKKMLFQKKKFFCSKNVRVLITEEASEGLKLSQVNSVEFIFNFFSSREIV